jgi:hypothetical protein
MTMKSGKNRTLKTAGCATHKVYLYALPRMIAVQTLANYAWRINPGWRAGITHAILGF